MEKFLLKKDAKKYGSEKSWVSCGRQKAEKYPPESKKRGDHENPNPDPTPVKKKKSMLD